MQYDVEAWKQLEPGSGHQFKLLKGTSSLVSRVPWKSELTGQVYGDNWCIHSVKIISRACLRLHIKRYNEKIMIGCSTSEVMYIMKYATVLTLNGSRRWMISRKFSQKMLKPHKLCSCCNPKSKVSKNFDIQPFIAAHKFITPNVNFWRKHFSIPLVATLQHNFLTSRSWIHVERHNILSQSLGFGTDFDRKGTLVKSL